MEKQTSLTDGIHCVQLHQMLYFRWLCDHHRQYTAAVDRTLSKMQPADAVSFYNVSALLFQLQLSKCRKVPQSQMLIHVPKNHVPLENERFRLVVKYAIERHSFDWLINALTYVQLVRLQFYGCLPLMQSFECGLDDSSYATPLKPWF